MSRNPMRGDTHVRLTRLASGDQHEVLALNRASRGLHRGWVAPPTTAAAFGRLLARSQEPGFAVLVIRRRSDGVLVGAIEISQIVRGAFCSAYLGYHIGTPWARHGYMTEALGLALTYAFTKLRLHRVEANVRPENTASLALLRRLGFTREGYSRRYLKIGGRWRDHERWAMLREDWHGRVKT